MGGEIAAVDEPEQALLEFVKLLTQHAHRATDEDVQRLRDVGWDDDQIAEAVFVTGLFAWFNRVADAFGLQDPQYRELAKSGGAAPMPAEKGN